MQRKSLSTPPFISKAGVDLCLWVMGRGKRGIWDFWAQSAPQCHPGTGCLDAFMPSSTGSNVRAGKGSGVATRISKILSVFGMRNQWRGSGLDPWYEGGLQG